MRLRGFVLALVPVAAVKDFLFRKCDQNPFCARNRHYAVQASEPEFVSPFTLDAGSVDASKPDQITAKLLKTTPGSIKEFTVRFDIVDDMSVRVVIDEPGRKLESKDVNAARFEPGSLMLDPTFKISNSGTEVKRHKSGLSVTFGAKRENKLVLAYAPFNVILEHNGEPQIVFNKRGALNLEHLRPKPVGDQEDLSWNSFESNEGAWEDTHDSKTDEKVKGPESIALDIDLPGFQHVYGIPEHADSLVLRDTHGKQDGDHKDPYRLFNVDIFEYEVNSPLPMYGSIPFMLAQKQGGSAGVLWLNSADTYVDVEKDQEEDETRTHWMSENGKLDLFLFVGNKPAEILRAYGRVTGMSRLPQQFAIGYHQCRWNYNSQEDVLDVDAKFDAHNIPYDVIWLDIEYTDKKKYFTWNKNQFQDPEQMMHDLDATKRKLVAIIDPHIKVEKKYPVYEDLASKSLAIKDLRGNPFHGHCWPGESVWIDALNPQSQEYWRSLFKMGDELGGDASNLHIWNDMNEPSVFDGPETSAPKGTRHYRGWEHRDVHNVYGQTVLNGTYDGMLSRYGESQRPFILTRSFFAGAQRLGAMWTGDNQAKWEYLQIATPMVLTSGLAGMPFAGADVGGFFGNPEMELLTRWYQAGAFYPFFRGHAHIDARRREPYLLAEPYKSTVTAAIELRYRLLPTFYTAFHEASTSLAPIMRPMFYEVPNNEQTYGVDDQFYIGDSLLVKPVVEPGVPEISVLFPDKQIYYGYDSGQEFEGPARTSVPVDLQTIPLFARGGTIHTRKDRPRRSAELMKNDPYTLVVAVGKDGKATGRLYADDGISFDYTKGAYVDTEFSYDGESINGRPIHAGEGTFKDLAIERIVVYGGDFTRASIGNTSLDVLESGKTLVIRNPRVTIGSNWSISLE